MPAAESTADATLSEIAWRASGGSAIGEASTMIFGSFGIAGGSFGAAAIGGMTGAATGSACASTIGGAVAASAAAAAAVAVNVIGTAGQHGDGGFVSQARAAEIVQHVKQKLTAYGPGEVVETLAECDFPIVGHLVVPFVDRC